MEVQREVSHFEEADTRDNFNYQNYYALLACILNENLDAGSAITQILGNKEKGIYADKGTRN